MHEASDRSWLAAASRLDSKQLECFVAVAEELSVSRAAARLHMTQPPLTRRIIRLEKELGATLFLRTSTGMVLTEVGATLLDRAYEVLDLIVAAFSETREVAARGPQLLTIAYEEEVVFSELPSLLGEFAARHRGAEIRLRRVPHSEHVDGLKTRAFDMAIGGTRPLPDDVVALTVRQESTMLAVPVSYPRQPGRRPFRLADLAGARMVTYPSTQLLLRPIAHPRVDAEHISSGGSVESGRSEATVETGGLLECLGHVAMGAGIALVPMSISRIGFPGVRFEDCVHAPTAALDVLWRRNASPLVVALAAFLDDRINGMSPDARESAGPTATAKEASRGPAFRETG